MKKLLTLFLTAVFMLSAMFTVYAAKSECWDCGGSGQCSDCGGSGSKFVDDFYVDADGDLIDDSRYETCSSCGGTGNCGTCYGSGEID